MAVDAGGTTIYPETPGSDIEWFKPGIPVPAWDDEDVTRGLVIYAEANTTVNGYSVPELTGDQITEAYNSVIVGRPVTIVDADEHYYLTVDQVDSINDEITLVALYFDVMILTYHDDETITYKVIS